eukprot:TRINITY_DN11384_c0_g1_i9.p1 TRINITY_DN11384_c0_g1~~TRINITY_DN11384_c0_g1_i9.p1  ORF type:complete len:135 (+),score=26.64 TRINITY_DN11384_c0_g1_i9:158-562(+)
MSLAGGRTGLLNALRNCPGTLVTGRSATTSLRQAPGRSSFHSSSRMRQAAKEEMSTYVKGRTPIELFKFSLFVSIPVIMMLHFRHPENLNYYISMMGYVRYPPEADRREIDPDTIMREIDATRSRKAAEKAAQK